MRILDLGAHDGFISAYVIDQLEDMRAAGGLPRRLAHEDLIVDGIELNSHGVAEFNRRLDARGIKGTCVQGAAEDAPRVFPTLAYDAVIAYELIEHVPDVDRFLDACEAMCARGGRIYLSTPDGTFGEGHNPHHLRAYRAVDLVELLRRRGDVQDMFVGADTITVASYVPWHATENLVHGRGEVAIYCGPGWKPWSPLDMLGAGGLGGSETAAARLAESLQKLGFTVTVYGEVEPGAHGQAVFKHWSTFDPTIPRAAVISSRIPELADHDCAADVQLLWIHDVDCGDRLTEERAAKFDAVLALSEWHVDHLAQRYPFLDGAGKLALISNGIEPSLFLGADPPRNPEQVVYTSSPDRGLDIVLRAWPLVLEQEPDAQLGYCYADVYDAVAAKRPEIAAFREQLNELTAATRNATNLGALSHPDVAAAMRASGVWVHPSWSTPEGAPFCETFCIGALEAAAAGCHLVAANRGALPERCRAADSFTLVDSGDEQLWADAIVSAIRAARDGVLPSAQALDTSWDSVAAQFVGLIEATVAA